LRAWGTTSPMAGHGQGSSRQLPPIRWEIERTPKEQDMPDALMQKGRMNRVVRRTRSAWVGDEI